MPVQENERGLRVLPLTGREPKKVGRPKKLEMPALPTELLEGMTDLEREHYDYFVAAYRKDYPGLTPTDLLLLNMAALEYINYLRVQAEQIRSGKVITMSRQHPAVQMRALLDMLSVTRKQRPKDDSAERAAVEELLKGLSG